MTPYPMTQFTFPTKYQKFCIIPLSISKYQTPSSKEPLSQTTMLHLRDNHTPNKNGLAIFFLLVALTLTCALILFSFYVFPLLSPFRGRRHDKVEPPITSTELAPLPRPDDTHTHPTSDSRTMEGGPQHEREQASPPHMMGGKDDGYDVCGSTATLPTTLPRVYHYQRQSLDDEPLPLNGMSPVAGVDMVSIQSRGSLR